MIAGQCGTKQGTGRIFVLRNRLIKRYKIKILKNK